MAQTLLIMGESGTGKTTSIRNCDPEITAIVNPVGKPLPFKGHFDTLDNETESDSIKLWIRDEIAKRKKLIIIDDFQYILSVPYMHRVKEQGWDKWNDFSFNYFDIIESCKQLPDDVVVCFMSHVETLDNGVTTIKLIGKQLREKITIEGLFTTVLMTEVDQGKYYFITQNNGRDTVKSPLGMFPSYAIDNDLNYVYNKICNFYEIGQYKSDSEMTEADAAVSVSVDKPAGRRGRGSRSSSEKTHDEVEKENQEKVNKYVEDTMSGFMDIPEDAGVPFDKVAEAAEKIDMSALDPVPQDTRKPMEKEDGEPARCIEDPSYFYLPNEDNYIMLHAGDVIPRGAQGISEANYKQHVIEYAMNPPEKPAANTKSRRTRKAR